MLRMAQVHVIRHKVLVEGLSIRKLQGTQCFTEFPGSESRSRTSEEYGFALVRTPSSKER